MGSGESKDPWSKEEKDEEVNDVSKYRVVLEVNVEKGGVSIQDFVEIGLNNFNKANESIIQATVLEVEELEEEK